MRIAFVRHGEVLDPADFDTGLTLEGHKRADLLGKRLASSSFKHLFSSRYRRAMQTAEWISLRTGLPIKIHDELNEMGYPPGEDTFDKVKVRVVKALRELMQFYNQDIIIVSHGGPIQAMVTSISSLDGVCGRGEMVIVEAESELRTGAPQG